MTVAWTEDFVRGKFQSIRELSTFTKESKSKKAKPKTSFCILSTASRTAGGYGSPHEKGIDGRERLAQQRDRKEVTNSRSESKKEQ
jgi:hypothetical protein